MGSLKRGMVKASKLLLLFLALFLLVGWAEAVGRRASSAEADGEFTLTEGSNRAGNDEEDEELTELGDAYDSKKSEASSLLDVAPVLKDANAVQKCGGAWATPSTWITDELSTTKTQLCVTKDLGTGTNYNTALTNGCLTTNAADSTKISREGVWNDGTDTRTGDDLKCTTAQCNTCGQTCMVYFTRGKDQTLEWTIGKAGNLQQVGVTLSYIKGSICKQRWFWNATKPATGGGLGACQHTIKCQTSRIIDSCVQSKCPTGAGNAAICTVGKACKDSTREGSYFAYPFMHM